MSRTDLSRTVEEHATIVQDLIALAPGLETVPLAEALGRVTSIAIASAHDLPLFTNSQMDGFAVVAADLERISGAQPLSLPIVGEIAARPSTPAALASGTAVRIMTGAVIPPGATAVVPVEDTTVDGDTVTIHRARAAGEFVRLRGSDLRAGEPLLPPGVRLASRHLAVLAAAGVAEVAVRSRVRVAVVTTGAELVAPGEPVAMGQIYDSNAIALQAAVRAAGAEPVHVIRSADDDAASLRAVLETVTATEGVDLILTSGGISMGNYEVVRDLLESSDGWVGHVAMQPGGPQATGRFGRTPVVSFPGNPVSTQISFELFVAPLLRQAAGLPAAVRGPRRLVGDVTSIAHKRQFLRGLLLDDDRVIPVSGPGSHLVAGLAASDVLIDIPAETIELKEGDTVQTLAL